MIDTVNKRSSSLGVGLPFLRVRPRPGSSITAAYRRQIAFAYSGFFNGIDKSVSTTLTISQSATKTREHSESVSNSLSINQTATKTFTFTLSIANSLTVSQTVSKTREHSETISQSLTVSQSGSRQWIHGESLSQSLTITQSGAPGGATEFCTSQLAIVHNAFCDRIAVDAPFKTIQFLSTEKTVIGSELTRGVRIKADKNNAGVLYIGLDDVNAAHSFWLYPNQEEFFSIDNTKRLFVLAQTDNDQASIYAVDYNKQPILGP